MDSKTHWETVYQTKAAKEVSWYRAHLDKSLALIELAALDLNAEITNFNEKQLKDQRFTSLHNLFARTGSKLGHKYPQTSQRHQSDQ